MIVTVSARCERLLRACPPARRGASVHLASAARTSAPCRPDTLAPPRVQLAVVFRTRAVLGVSPGPALEPGAGLTAAYCTVDNFAGNVDGEAAESFFRAQAVDGIGAGSGGSGRRSLSIVPISILSLRTA
jgi:hypothetical protein